MLNAVTINRTTPRNEEILDVLDFMTDELGSASNAAVQCIRDSQRFKDAQIKFNGSRNPGPEDPARPNPE